MNKEEAKKLFGKNFRELRLAKGMSQEELAHALGFKNRSSVNKIELGKNDMPRALVLRAAQVLGVSPVKLFTTDNEIKDIINQLPDLDVEDKMLVENATFLGTMSVNAYEDNLEHAYDSTRTRGVNDTSKPEMISPLDLLPPTPHLMSIYEKLSPNSQEELEKYAEYLLAREKNK